MGKKSKWCWTSALIAGATAATFIAVKPKPPTFRLVSLTALRLNLNGLAAAAVIKEMEEKEEPQQQLKFPRLDADLILTIHVINPNILPVKYKPTSLSIYYDGSLLGSADVPAGSQGPKSCQLVRIPARLNGGELAQHAVRLIGDVAKRKMVISADVDIRGWVKAIVWDPRFKVHVDSRIVVDPLLLDVVDQECESRLQMFAK